MKPHDLVSAQDVSSACGGRRSAPRRSPHRSSAREARIAKPARYAFDSKNGVTRGGEARLTTAVALVRGAGVRLLLQTLAEVVWGERTYLGLRSELGELPPPRPAKFEIRMEPRECPGFDGFADELRRARGRDCLQVVLLRRLCEAGVRELHVATAPDGSPAYCQWVVGESNQDLLHAHSPGRHPRLARHEVLLEGAYTFTRFRGLGLMADGMWQLLTKARDAGARSAITYVATESVPALRGCARVGFAPDHVRHNVRRLGRTRSFVRPVDDELLELWAAATAPKGRA